MKEVKRFLGFVCLFFLALNQNAFAEENTVFYDYFKEEVVVSSLPVKDFSIKDAKSFCFTNDVGEKYFVFDFKGTLNKQINRQHYKDKNLAINKIAFAQNNVDKIRIAFRTNGKKKFDYFYDQEEKNLIFSLRKIKNNNPEKIAETKIKKPEVKIQETGNLSENQTENNLNEKKEIVFGNVDDIFSDDKKTSEKKDKKFSFKGHVQSAYYGSLKQEKNKDNSESNSDIFFEAKYNLNKNLTFLASANINATYLSEKEKFELEPSVQELYIKYQPGNKFEFCFGNQIVRWGKTDQISPLDNVNPQDYGHFVVPDLEDRKMPVLMATASYTNDNFKIEGIFVPFFKPADLDYFGTNWAVLGHLKEDVREVNPFLANFTDRVDVVDNTPEKSLENSEFGFRISKTFFEDCDIEFIYINSFNDIGFVKNVPNIIKTVATGDTNLPFLDDDIEITYEKYQTFGLALETILFDKIGFRAETGYKSNENFLGKDLNGYKSPLYFFVANGDYTTKNDLYINAGVSLQYTVDHNSEMMVDQNDLMFFGEVTKHWEKISSKTGCTFAYDMDGGSKISPFLRYTGMKNVEAEIKFDIFSGPENTILGHYKDNDQVGLSIKYYF